MRSVCRGASKNNTHLPGKRLLWRERNGVRDEERRRRGREKVER